MKVEEEMQPRLLGSSPTPPHPTRAALATGEVSGTGTGPLHHPLANYSPSPWQTQPWDQGDPPAQSTSRLLSAGKGHTGLGQAAGIQMEQP